MPFPKRDEYILRFPLDFWTTVLMAHSNYKSVMKVRVRNHPFSLKAKEY